MSNKKIFFFFHFLFNPHSTLISCNKLTSHDYPQCVNRPRKVVPHAGGHASIRGVWSIGSDVILKDRPDEGLKAKVEVNTLNYLATHTDIPIPKVEMGGTSF